MLEYQEVTKREGNQGRRKKAEQNCVKTRVGKVTMPTRPRVMQVDKCDTEKKDSQAYFQPHANIILKQSTF